MNYIDTQSLGKFNIKALDGEIGSVTDFYFDEDLFYLRYFAINTRSFLQRNLVLVSPISFHQIDTENRLVEVLLSKEELENSPSIESVEVISNQYEIAYNDHFSWPYYWGHGNSAWAIGPYGTPWGDYGQIDGKFQSNEKKDKYLEKARKNNLRSSKEICSYSVRAEDKDFGHIQGFILDSETLSIDFVIIDTINFLPSKTILIRPEWIENISWQSQTLKVPFSRETIKSAPEYVEGDISRFLIQQTDDHFRDDLLKKYKKLSYLEKFDKDNGIGFLIKESRCKLKMYKESECERREASL